MKTKFKYIRFVEIIKTRKGKTIWACRANRTKNLLGTVEWYETWNQYIFSPNADTVFDAACLQDVVQFVEGLK